MVHLERPESISVQLELLLRFFDLDIPDLKRKLRGDHSERVHHTHQSFGADHRKRLCPLRISHRKQKSRKSPDMIPVKMSEADHIDGFETPALLSERDLGSFAAVNQQAGTVQAHDHGS